MNRTIGIWLVLVMIVGVVMVQRLPVQDSWSRETWDKWLAERNVAYLIAQLEALDVEMRQLQHRIVDTNKRL